MFKGGAPSDAVVLTGNGGAVVIAEAARCVLFKCWCVSDLFEDVLVAGGLAAPVSKRGFLGGTPLEVDLWPRGTLRGELRSISPTAPVCTLTCKKQIRKIFDQCINNPRLPELSLILEQIQFHKTEFKNLNNACKTFC